MADDRKNGVSIGTWTILLALVSITVAIYAPMSLRISSLERQSEVLQNKIAAVESDARLVYLLKTDMQVVNRRLDEADGFFKWWYEHVPQIDARQDEKIEKLEWWLYGKGEASMFKDDEE